MVDDHALDERGNAKQLTGQRAFTASGTSSGDARQLASPVPPCRPIRLQPIARELAASLDDRVRGKQTRLDRLPDALAALRIRDARGIADQHHAVVDQVSGPRCVDGIGVTAPSPRKLRRDPAGRLEERDEPLCRRRQRAGIEPAEPDIEVIAFAHAPAVTLQIAAEKQLRHIGFARSPRSRRR